jgi:hypothetical protein
MAALTLDIISPIVRARMLSRNILDGVGYSGYGDRVLSEYQAQNIFYAPLDLEYKLSGDYHLPMLELGSILNVRGSTDGYEGNVRRANYSKQWDKRGNTEDAGDYIYRNIEEPDDRLVKLWGDSERNQYRSYLDYTNALFGHNDSSSLSNIIAGIATGDGIGLSLGGGRISVVSDLDIQQTLAGRIFGSFSGKETPLGKFGLKAAAVAMSQTAIRKTSGIVSGAVNEGLDWVLNKISGGHLGDGDFDMSSYLTDTKSITNKPDTVADDILSATGLSGVINMVAGGLGLGGVLNDITDVTKTATLEKPNYIEIDVDGVLIPDKTQTPLSPNFRRYLDAGIGGNIISTVLNHSLQECLGDNSCEFGILRELGRLDSSSPHNYTPDFRKEQQNTLIEWTGFKNAETLFNNLNFNKYGPGYTKTSGKKNITAPNTNYWLDLLESDYFDDAAGRQIISNNLGADIRVVSTWADKVGNIAPTEDEGVAWKANLEYINSASGGTIYNVVDKTIYPNINTLMGKTAMLFEMGKAKTIISSFGNILEKPSPIQTAIDLTWGISKGRNLLKITPSVTSSGYVDPYCRVWTWEKQYRSALDTIRPFIDDSGNAAALENIHKEIQDNAYIRPHYEWFTRRTSLQNNGRVKIAPHKSDFDGNDPDGRGREPWDGKKENRFKFNDTYFFSIENLAWKDLILEDVLCPSQIGPNGGRIMWFSPLNLDFDENVHVDLNGETFIGRGEQIFTYVNTERSGSLRFTMVVDHSSFTEYMEARKFDGNDKEQYQTILRFDAGCEFPTLHNPYTREPKSTSIPEFNIPEPQPNIPPPQEKTTDIDVTTLLVRVYFPNDYTGKDEPYDITNGHGGYEGYERGTAAMAYLYSGNPSVASSKGYEMAADGTTLSDVNKSLQMTNVIGEVATNINCKNPNVNTFKLTNGNDVNAVEHFSTNMYKTDIMYNPNRDKEENYLTEEQAKKQRLLKTRKIPGREDLLPRYGFFRLVYNWDFENHMLNATRTGDAELSFKDLYEILINKTTYQQWDFNNIYDIISKAKKVRITGNASAHGVGDNKKLARNRAIALAYFIQETLGVNVFGDTDKFEIGIGSHSVEGSYDLCSSSKKAKMGRFAQIEITTVNSRTDIINNEDIQKADDQFKAEQNEYLEKKNTFKATTVTATYVGRYDEEMEFYQYLDTRTDLTFSNIKDKYKHYIPCFWSLTPEGFNARLTFLHQCTRQGPTIGASDMSVNTNNPTNLSFGRPPVCILRIGDFIQSRIYIESLSISYKNGQSISWDTNPEGIGPQPMTADVNISFKFMGGQDLSGAISRLQNAITFNYYANTGVYDDRSDSNYYFMNFTSGESDEKNWTPRSNTGKKEYLFNPTVTLNGKDESGNKTETTIPGYTNGIDYKTYLGASKGELEEMRRQQLNDEKAEVFGNGDDRTENYISYKTFLHGPSIDTSKVQNNTNYIDNNLSDPVEYFENINVDGDAEEIEYQAAVSFINSREQKVPEVAEVEEYIPYVDPNSVRR